MGVTKLEEVARTMWLSVNTHIDPAALGEWEDHTEASKVLWREAARDAVKALREPTIEMFHAFEAARTATHESLGAGFAWGNGWHAAIDAILNEPQT